MKNKQWCLFCDWYWLHGRRIIS